MPEAPEPHPVGSPASGEPPIGRHGLGPHVVGRRVVVRRVLRGQTGPTGGPAFTDVLGVCTAWGDDVCVVESDRGPVRIALADVVSGKPVPARPSVRHRVSVLDAERHTARLWAGITVVRMGDWELRHEETPAGRRRKRANSALALGDPSLPLPDAAARVVGHYGALGLTPMVQVERDSTTEAGFASLGWAVVPGGDADFLMASVSRALRASVTAAPGAEPRLRTLDDPSAGRRADAGPLAHPHAPSVEVVLEQEGRRAAWGRGALDGDWLGLHAIEVAPEHRRRGLGTTAVAALLEWGAERGATTAWLHVETDNVPALALYERLGFSAHHGCRYLTPAPASA